VKVSCHHFSFTTCIQIYPSNRYKSLHTLWDTRGIVMKDIVINGNDTISFAIRWRKWRDNHILRLRKTIIQGGECCANKREGFVMQGNTCYWIPQFCIECPEFVALSMQENASYERRGHTQYFRFYMHQIAAATSKYLGLFVIICAY